MTLTIIAAKETVSGAIFSKKSGGKAPDADGNEASLMTFIK